MWPIHMCDMTHSHVRHDSFMHVTCRVHMFAQTHVTWLIHMCDVSHSYVCHDTLHMCDLSHSYVQCAPCLSFLCAPCLSFVCATNSFTCLWFYVPQPLLHVSDSYVPWHVSHVSHFYVPRPASHVRLLSHWYVHYIIFYTCNMSYSYVQRDTFMLDGRPWMSHVPYTLCHTYEWGMFDIWNNHVTHMKKSRQICKWVTPNIRMRQITQVQQSSHIYQWVMSQIWKRLSKQTNNSPHSRPRRLQIRHHTIANLFNTYKYIYVYICTHIYI